MYTSVLHSDTSIEKSRCCSDLVFDKHMGVLRMALLPIIAEYMASRVPRGNVTAPRTCLEVSGVTGGHSCDIPTL